MRNGDGFKDDGRQKRVIFWSCMFSAINALSVVPYQPPEASTLLSPTPTSNKLNSTLSKILLCLKNTWPSGATIVIPTLLCRICSCRSRRRWRRGV